MYLHGVHVYECTPTQTKVTTEGVVWSPTHFSTTTTMTLKEGEGSKRWNERRRLLQFYFKLAVFGFSTCLESKTKITVLDSFVHVSFLYYRTRRHALRAPKTVLTGFITNILNFTWLYSTLLFSEFRCFTPTKTRKRVSEKEGFILFYPPHQTPTRLLRSYFLLSFWSDVKTLHASPLRSQHILILPQEQTHI